MNRRTSAHPVLVLAAGAGLLALGACSTGPSGGTAPTAQGGAGSAGGDPASSTTAAADPGDGSTATPGAADGHFPTTIEHAFGETTIEADPQRVVTVGWSDHDVVAALGEVPVGATRISWGGNDEGSTDFFDAAIGELGATPAEVTRLDDSDGIPVEEIAALEPDVILGTNSGLTQEDYDALSRIAPVVAYPEVAWGTPWRESVEMIGQALGRPAEAQESIAETEALIEETAAAYPELEGTSVAWAWFTPQDLSTIGLYTTTDLRPQMLRELGMVDAGIVTEQSTDGAFSINVSAEQADTIDADVLIFYTDGGIDPEALVSDPLVGRIPALEAGSFVAAGDPQAAQGLSSPSPLSIPVALEEFIPEVAEAAAKAG